MVRMNGTCRPRCRTASQRAAVARSGWWWGRRQRPDDEVVDIWVLVQAVYLGDEGGCSIEFGWRWVEVEVVFVLVDVDGGGWASKYLFRATVARMGMALMRAVSSVSFLLQTSLWQGHSDV